MTTRIIKGKIILPRTIKNSPGNWMRKGRVPALNCSIVPTNKSLLKVRRLKSKKRSKAHPITLRLISFLYLSRKEERLKPRVMKR